jgi:hypothetical protein
MSITELHYPILGGGTWHRRNAFGPGGYVRGVRFLLSPRWIGFFLAVVALAVVCVLMGDWQWHKREVRHESNERVERHLAADPVPLDDVVARGARTTTEQEWTRVLVSGRYDPSGQVTVKFRTRDGRPGADVVTPLLLDDGTAVLVDRGWVQTSNTDVAPEDVPAPPPGRVEREAWLRPDSGALRDRPHVAVPGALGLPRPALPDRGHAGPRARAGARPRRRPALLLRAAVVVLRCARPRRVRLLRPC